LPYQATAKTRQKQAETRQRILRAAHELIGQGGYAAASVAAVAQRAGVATGTTYRYFPSKGELFAEVFRRASQIEVDHMARAAESDGSLRERLVRACQTFARRALRGRRMAYALIAEPVDPAVDAERITYRQAYTLILERLVREGVATGACPPQDPAVTAAFLVGGLGEALVGPLAPEHRPVDEPLLIASITQAACRAVFGGTP